MPAKVIAKVHQLVAACKKYKGIVFTNKDVKIVNNDSNHDDNTLETTGVDTTNDNTLENTGVSDNTPEITGVSDNTPETTEETETVTETEMRNNKHNITPNTDNEPNVTGHRQDEDYEQYDDDISIEGKTPEDIHITLKDMITVHEMNVRQLYVDPDTGEAMEEEIDMSTHGYNLHPRPIKRNKKYNMVSI